VRETDASDPVCQRVGDDATDGPSGVASVPRRPFDVTDAGFVD
jgi:hypothetical protein